MADKTMTLNLSEREMDVLDAMATDKDMSKTAINKMPAPRKPRVCGSWPRCYHGAVVGGIFGCYGSR